MDSHVAQPPELAVTTMTGPRGDVGASAACRSVEPRSNAKRAELGMVLRVVIAIPFKLGLPLQRSPVFLALGFLGAECARPGRRPETDEPGHASRRPRPGR